jgi:uroporphyrin-III C-methyltransferase/precorrin-2 dehydrogenase/sirohydrochlorin ferrochelatase
MLRDGRRDEACQAASAIASGEGRGWVALVGAGPGDPGLLTLAGRDLLASADTVFHDALVRPETLALCGPGVRLVDVGKRGGGHAAGQAGITAALVEAARRGEYVVRLKGGDPFVFGRGGEEVEALLGAGVEVLVVPGVSSAVAAAGVAGIPLTLRGVAASVGVVSGHCAGEGAVPAELERVAASVDTLVVLMPLANLDRLTARLAAVLGCERPAALVAEATLPGQRLVRAPLGALPEAARGAGVRAPATLVVGQVALGLARWAV